MTDVLQPMPPYVLLGRVVTMDAADQVIENGAIYIRDGRIKHVTKSDASAPDGFKNCLRIDTGGTIYPGMIELHNHLSYNILPPLKIPKKYYNRGQWKNTSEKRKYISGPMELLNKAGGYLGAIVRYVEAKCLLAGVTTSQGLTLVNANGIQKKYRGIVRNAEEPDDKTLPKAGHKIEDVDPTNLDSFLSILKQQKGCYLMHLSEGVDDVARKHFLNLQLDSHHESATNALAGIHSTGLSPADFDVLKNFGGSIVWSPLSNLLLYGGTADVGAAKQRGVLIALGSDWSPTGSKNLLNELKIARLYSQIQGDLFTDIELVRMVTSTPARILKWQDTLGTIEPSKLADLFVVKGQQGDSYKKLLTSNEVDIQLVVIGGMPRYGTTALMKKLGQTGEKWRICGKGRLLNLRGAPDADVSTLTLKQALEKLTEGMEKLPEPPALPVAPVIADAFAGIVPVTSWQLELDNDGDEAQASRAFAPLTTGDVIGEFSMAAADLHSIVEKMTLDELTVAENPRKYYDQLKVQINLPAKIRESLTTLYI